MAFPPISPEVLSPTYWGGVDIHDPETHRPDNITSYDVTHVSLRTDIMASVQLSLALTGVRRNEASEMSNAFGANFGPTSDQLADGRAVIIEGEILRLHVGEDGEPVACPEYDSGLRAEYEGSPLTRPYLRAWADHLGEAGLGYEESGLNEGSLYHLRYFSFGVLARMRRGDNGRPMVMYNFDAARVDAKGLVSVGPHAEKQSRIATRLPITVGKTLIRPVDTCAGVEMRDIERIKSISMVPPPGSGERKERRKPLAERVREPAHVRTGLALPEH